MNNIQENKSSTGCTECGSPSNLAHHNKCPKLGGFEIRKKKYKALITMTQPKKDFMETYTLRARIGIYIGKIIGLIHLDIK